MPVAKARVRLDGSDPINRGLLGFWPLDDNAGTIAREISPYRRIANNSSPLVRSVAPFGRYTSYNATGTTVYNGRILSGLENWSIVAAIKNTTANTPGGKAIYCERAPSGNDILKLDICNAFSNNSADIVIRDTAGNLLFVSGSTTTVNDGKWHVLVATKRGTAVTLYVDGRVEATGTWTGTNTFTNSGTLSTIGSDTGDASGNYVGDAARVRVLGRALSPTEVWRLSVDPWAGTERHRAPALYITGGSTFNDTIADAVTAAESNASAATVRPTLSDAATAAESNAAALTANASLSDAATGAESSAAVATVNATLSDPATAADDVTGTVSTVYNETISDDVVAGDDMPSSVPVGGGTRRARKGFRRIRLPVEEPSVAYQSSSIPPELKAQAKKAWQDDDDEWILLA